MPLQDLKESIVYWYDKTRSRITYEYVVWEGINDTPADIRAFLDFCKAAPCKVNLIEYNPIDDGDFRQASRRSHTGLCTGTGGRGNYSHRPTFPG